MIDCLIFISDEFFILRTLFSTKIVIPPSIFDVRSILLVSTFFIYFCA
jgi:hypothetical protein